MSTRIKKEWKRNHIVYLVLIPIVLHFLFFQVIPFILAFVMSFFHWNYINKPLFLGFQNWGRIVHDQVFLKSMVNTGLFSLYFVVPVIVLGLVLALLINSKLNKLKFVRSMYYLPVVTSFVVLSALWLWLFASGDYGIINNFLKLLHLSPQPFYNSETQALQVLSLLSIYKCAGTIMIYYYAALKNIPDTLYEAATIDGANERQKLMKITLPTLQPTTFYVLILAITWSFQVFDSAYLITSGGPNNSTQTIVYQIYLNAFTGAKGGYASAQSVLLFLMILTITLILKRFNKNDNEA